ncbi:MAG TPA: hypothetical protein ENN32_04805 [Chloroflexi bacterium]|nr:hypothetical protein [Chloroflexota bacterium]
MSLGSNYHLRDRLRSAQINRGAFYSAIILTALIFFEIFNFSTTHFALSDLLGDLKFLGVRWATGLSIAFTCIDFAGISRLFAPEEGQQQPHEMWFLFGAWLLAATMNASLTWWGVSIALYNHSLQSAAIIDSAQVLRVVPLFIAILVWVIRVLVIGTVSVHASQHSDTSTQASRSLRNPSSAGSVTPLRRTRPDPISAQPTRPASRSESRRF